MQTHTPLLDEVRALSRRAAWRTARARFLADRGEVVRRALSQSPQVAAAELADVGLSALVLEESQAARALLEGARRALSRARDASDPMHTRVLTALGRAQAHPAERLAHFERAQHLAHRESDDEAELEAALLAGEVLLGAGRLREADARFARARVLSASAVELARVELWRGAVALRQGEHDASARRLSRALVFARGAVASPALLARVHIHRAHLAWRAGDFRFAARAFDRARALRAQALGPVCVDTAAVFEQAAALHRGRGHLDEAERALTRALFIYEQHHEGPRSCRLSIERVLVSLAGLYRSIGCSEAASRMHARAQESRALSQTS